MASTEKSSRRVLVVDDNRDAADTLSLLLTLEGYEVRVAYDGQEALDVFRESRAEVAVLDLNMPRLDGFEAARPSRR